MNHAKMTKSLFVELAAHTNSMHARENKSAYKTRNNEIHHVRIPNMERSISLPLPFMLCVRLDSILSRTANFPVLDIPSQVPPSLPGSKSIPVVVGRKTNI